MQYRTIIQGTIFYYASKSSALRRFRKAVTAHKTLQQNDGQGAGWQTILDGE